MSQPLLIARQGAVVTLTLNRPEVRNALSREMTQQMEQAFRDIERDASCRCVVVRGQGDHFMAGGDVKNMHANRERTPAQRRDEFEHFINQLHPTMTLMRRLPKPILASVRGGVAGFGMSLMMACDLAIAGEDSFYTLAYCHIGVSPDGSSTYSLPRLVGMRKAMEIAMLGERFDAAEALRLGLVNKVVAAAALEAETAKLAARLAAGPTRAYGHIKRLLHASLGRDYESQLQAEAEAFADCASGADFIEGITAFVEKRPPRFQGS
ncbi:MAG: enoyl-CoA hydratase [Alphaproteobacteria bacterium]|nr:enoyl-CoA hydratase [Alphaproteobacteria bacterium]